jgi:hypothetical protein
MKPGSSASGQALALKTRADVPTDGRVPKFNYRLPSNHSASCRIPDDCIDSKRYPLFMARAVLQELIESLQSTQGVKPC